MAVVTVLMNKADIERGVPLTERDVTQRKLPKLEEQLNTASLRFDMAATGDLPTGVATDSKLLQAAGPVNTVAPAVTGTTESGATLTTSNGTWSNSPLGYSYNWQSSTDSGATWVDIVEGNGLNTYVVDDSLVDATIRAVVTAASATGAAIKASAAVGPITEPA